MTIFTQQPGFTRVELRLTRVFMIIYPAVTVGVLLLTLLVNLRLLPALAF